MSSALSERTRLISSSTAKKPHHNLAGLPPWQFRLICLANWSCGFLVSLDSTVVATLLTPIGSYFNASNQASWLGTAYLLSLCCFTPIYGRLSDLIGRRNAHLIAGVWFILGTIMCAFAPSMIWLIVARAIAGIGGGGVQSLSVIIMNDLVDLKHRGVFQVSLFPSEPGIGMAFDWIGLFKCLLRPRRGDRRRLWGLHVRYLWLALGFPVSDTPPHHRRVLCIHV
jgi:MFS family permease